MKVVELYTTIQGEGREIGTPIHLVRLWGCNMYPKCEWCDSKYSWKDLKRSRYYNEKGLVLKLLNMYNKTKIKHYLWTGGEPTIYENEVKNVVNKLHTAKHSLETNGLKQTKINFNLITVSPKKQNYDLNVLKKYNKMKNVDFKFVYDKSRWWEKVIEDVGIDNSKVWIMPEGCTKKQQLLGMKEVFNYCIERRYNFTPRLHILTWNNKRRV